MVGQALTDPRLTSGLIAGPAPRQRARLPDRVPRRARPDRAGHRRGGLRRHAARPVPARRRADRAAAGPGPAAGPRRRHPGRARRCGWTPPWPTSCRAGVGLADAVAAATRIPADLIGCPAAGPDCPGCGRRPSLARPRPAGQGDLDRRTAGLRGRRASPVNDQCSGSGGTVTQRRREGGTARTVSHHGPGDRRAARRAAGHHRRPAAAPRRGGRGWPARPGRSCSSPGAPPTTRPSTAAT